MSRGSLSALMVLAATWISCASSPPPFPGVTDDPRTQKSGIDPEKFLVNLTPEERGRFCDWNAYMLGGYGKTIRCPAFSVETFKTREECVESRSQLLTMCVATVEDSEACARARRADSCKNWYQEICLGKLMHCWTKAPPKK